MSDKCVSCRAVLRLDPEKEEGYCARCFVALPIPSSQAVERHWYRILLRLAPHHQGGHSDTGSKIADLLEVDFPLRMETLAPRALRLNFKPPKLWPWSPTARPPAQEGNEKQEARTAAGRTGKQE